MCPPSLNSQIFQVLEYEAGEDEDRWVEIGDLKSSSGWHAALSIGPPELPCLAGRWTTPRS